MVNNRMKLDILPNIYLNPDGTFNKDAALDLGGKIAGVCYDKEGFSHLVNEDSKRTQRRVDMTLNNGHHSVYDHIIINMNIKNIPKMLAMVLNNEKQYATSEKSARYTKVEPSNSITPLETSLYNKWLEIFKIKIDNKYGNIFNKSKIEKLAQENARYLVSSFMPTEMIYSTSLRQINYIASWMMDYTDRVNFANPFKKKLAFAYDDFVSKLEEKNIIEPKLLLNEKNRNLSLFGNDLEKRKEYFGDIYQTKYKGSLAQFAQAQRHRTINYQMQFLDEKEYFVPKILDDDPLLKDVWLNDMESVKDIFPQGEKVLINETGTYDNFILKSKERLCTHAQLEIMLQMKETLLKYKDMLKKTDHHLKDDIIKYTHGARCTFPDYTCFNKCNFDEGIKLERKI